MNSTGYIKVFGVLTINQWKTISRNSDGTYTAASIDGVTVTDTLGKLLENEWVKAEEIELFFSKLLKRNRIDEKQYKEVITQLIIEIF